MDTPLDSPASDTRLPALQPIAGRVAWYGKELAASGDWVRRLDAPQLETLDAALRAVDSAGTATFAIKAADFPLPGFAALIADLHDELENGRGVVRLTGLDPSRYSVEQLRRLFWGLGTHVGTAVYQTARGELIGEVRDESFDAEKTYVAPTAGKVASARSRSRSTGPLRFHTDRCDVIALLCASNGMEGGISKLVSSVTVHNEILRRRPDLCAVLYEDFWRARPQDEDGGDEDGPARNLKPYFALPVFGQRDGKFSSQYSRTYVEQAQEFAEVPRLTAQQVEAMDLLAAVAEEVCLHVPFAPGDMQFVNNHVAYHGRTAYEDDRGTGQSRLLLRLWLSPRGNRALPAGYERAWTSTAANTVRGGFIPRRTVAPAA